MEKQDTGILLNPTNIKLHRKYFSEMVRLIGINVIYRAPRKDKHYDGYGELDSFYYEPIIVGCIFEEHVNQWTMKKLGWNSELQAESTLIHVPYNLKDIQVGALFIVPSGIDNTQGRVFKVLRLQVSPVYPASLVCELGPMFENTFEPAQLNHYDNNFNLLVEEKESL